MCEDLDALIMAEVDKEIARRCLLDFCRYVDPKFMTGRPQRALSEELEKIESGANKRLLVSMPPRHGKSRIITQLFPCWYLGKHPEAEIIQTTYAHPLSVKHSRRARDIFISEEYAQLFPNTRFKPGRESQEAIAVARQAADEWGTLQGGQYYAVGVGGSVTGHGADVAIMDDPLKGRRDANSPTMREAAWDFYTSTLYTRLSPDGAIIVLLTRWHPDDPAGRIIEQIRQGGEKWTAINLPAWDETETEALWPERWPVEKLREIRSAIGSYEWASLYMGQPVIRGGNHYKVDNIVFHRDDKQFPKEGYSRVWDLASTQKERATDDPDFTAGALGALTVIDGQEHFWLRDMRSGQWAVTMRDAAIVQAARDDGDKVNIGIEAVGGYKDAVNYIREKIKKSGLVRNVHAISGKELGGDKVSRGTPIEAIIEAGCFHVLQSTWTDRFILTMSEFPNGKHDDEPDSVSLCYHECKRRRFEATDGDLRGKLRI